MFLASTSDILRIVTGTAVTTIGVQAAWVDNTTGTYTPGRTNTAITGATTTTVVASPGASTVRNVKHLNVTNNHATSSCVITIQHYDGTTSVDLEKITLYAGEQFVMCEDGEWRHLTAAGGEYEYSAPSRGNLGISGTLAETVAREMCIEANLSTIASGATGIYAIRLTAGMLITNISFFSATTAAGTPTSQIFGLYSRGGTLLAKTADDGSTAWGANSIKTLALTSAYRIQVTDLYYLAVSVTAATAPTFKGVTVGTTMGVLSPVIRNNAVSGVLPDHFAFPVSTPATQVWAAVT